jgi:hypothetical protein
MIRILTDKQLKKVTDLIAVNFIIANDVLSDSKMDINYKIRKFGELLRNAYNSAETIGGTKEYKRMEETLHRLLKNKKS